MYRDYKTTRISVFVIISLLTIAGAGCADDEKVEPTGLLKEDEQMERRSILAGSWYPGDSAGLRKTVEEYFNQADLPVFDGRIVGVISPHAGYVYSGPVAAYSYKALYENREKYRGSTFVIIGPNHRTAGFNKISIWAKGRWRTPLGAVSIDEELAASLLDELGSAAVFDKNVHNNEHSLEIQLPFLQYALGEDFKIVPIVFGSQSDAVSRQLADALKKHGDRKDIIIVASTDLSHYHPESQAHRLDRKFVDGVLSGSANELSMRLQTGQCEACGFGAVLTLMRAAGAFGADTIVELRYATSADVPAGDSSQVVGYLATIFLDTGKDTKLGDNQESEAESFSEEYSLTDEQKIYLLKLARKTIEDYVKNGEIYEPKAPDDEKLVEDGAVFVTIHKDGMLRGCIGQMIPQGSLYLSVRDMAISACSRDHRFYPVSPEELDDIDIEISVLSPMSPIDDWQKIELGKHGVWLVKNGRSGVFLPQVGLNPGWTLEYFLEELSSQKAGLPRNAYKDPETQLFIFTVVLFDEHEFGLK